MFERLKAIWNLPEKLEIKEDELKSYANLCQACAEKNIKQRFEQHKNDIRGVIKSFSKTLTELREMVHPDHAKVENFSERISKLEKALLELNEKVDRINDRYWFEQFSTDKELDSPQKEDPEVDFITLQGKPFEYFIQQLELSGHSNELLKAQRRYINRLLRLLRTTAEDPGKSITEDLRKAEKWNKVLKRRFKAWKEDYIGNK